MEHGIVKDWNDMERIWQYVYSKEQLQTFSEEVWVYSARLRIYRMSLSLCRCVSILILYITETFTFT